MERRPRARRRCGIAWLWAILPAVAGCDEPEAGQGLALKAALAAAEQAALDTRVDPDRLGDPAQRHRVFRREFARHGGRLGPVRLTTETRYALRPAAGGEALEVIDRRRAEMAANGDFALDDGLAWRTPGEAGEDGRRCWRLAGESYAARRTGPATHFAERGGESDRCLDAAVEPVQSWLQTFERALAVSAEAGPETAGRSTVRLTLAKAPESDSGGAGGTDAKAPAPALPSFWQENATGTGVEETAGVPGPRPWLVASHGELRAFEGVLLLDEETGLPLSARLEARLAVRKAGQTAELIVGVNMTAEVRTGPIGRPDDVIETGPRPRIFRDRAALLGEKLGGGAPVALPRPGDAPPLALDVDAEGESPEASPPSAPPAGHR